MNEPTLEKITDKPPSLEELQGKVGGFAELLNLPDGGQLLFDEDGLMKKLPPNRDASRLAMTPIVGNAVHLTGKGKIK